MDDFTFTLRSGLDQRDGKLDQSAMIFRQKLGQFTQWARPITMLEIRSQSHRWTNQQRDVLEYRSCDVVEWTNQRRRYKNGFVPTVAPFATGCDDDYNRHKTTNFIKH